MKVERLLDEASRSEGFVMDALQKYEELRGMLDSLKDPVHSELRIKVAN